MGAFAWSAEVGWLCTCTWRGVAGRRAWTRGRGAMGRHCAAVRTTSSDIRRHHRTSRRPPQRPAHRAQSDGRHSPSRGGWPRHRGARALLPPSVSCHADPSSSRDNNAWCSPCHGCSDGRAHTARWHLYDIKAEAAEPACSGAAPSSPACETAARRDDAGAPPSAALPAPLGIFLERLSEISRCW